MRLPASILGTVRGPLVAAALTACAGGGEPLAIEPEPAPRPPEAVALPPAPLDPVAYDERLEAERVASADLAVGADAARRSRRIAVNVAHARAAPRLPVNRPSDWGRVRCGRG